MLTKIIHKSLIGPVSEYMQTPLKSGHFGMKDAQYAKTSEKTNFQFTYIFWDSGFYFYWKFLEYRNYFEQKLKKKFVPKDVQCRTNFGSI